MPLDVASQCKGNGLIEVFVQVLATGRQKYLLADRWTLEGHHWKIRQFWDEWRWMVASTTFVCPLHRITPKFWQKKLIIPLMQAIPKLQGETQLKPFKNVCDPYRFFSITLTLLEKYYSSTSHSLAENVHSEKQVPDREFLCFQNEIIFAVISQSRIVSVSTQTVVRFQRKHDCVQAKKAQGISPGPASGRDG